MTSRPPTRRLALALTLALSLGAFVAALLGPAQTLAQTRKATCPTATTRVKAKRATRACARPSHRGKAKTRRTSKRHVELAPAKKTTKTSAAASPPAPPALCEDGATPVRAADGSFSCADGSEPECEGGATPTTSRNGDSLLCPVTTEAESAADEAECEEEEAFGCSVAGEQTCEVSSSDGSAFACEGEG